MGDSMNAEAADQAEQPRALKHRGLLGELRCGLEGERVGIPDRGGSRPRIRGRVEQRADTDPASRGQNLLPAPNSPAVASFFGIGA